MRAASLVVFLALALAADAGAAPRESFNYYFVIDCSGSMAGRPSGSGNANIMPRVKKAVNDFLGKVSLGSRVAILPFDSRVHDAKWVTLASEQDRGTLERFVEDLDPRGPRTCIYPAVSQAVRWMRAVPQRFPEFRHISTILLYTDGLNDCEDGLTLAEVLREFRLGRAENDYLFYTTLGVNLPQGDKALLSATPGVRYVAEPKGQLEPISLVEVRPAALDFGSLQGVAKSTRRLALVYHEGHLRGETLTASLEIEALGEREAVRISPQDFRLQSSEAEFTLELLNPESFSQRAFTGELKLRASRGRVHFTPENIAVSFDTMPPRTLDITSPSPLPAVLGELPFSPDGLAAAEVRFLVGASTSAASAGTTLSAEVELAAANPSALAGEGRVFLESGPARGRAIALPAGARELRLRLALAKGECAPGAYSGRVVLTADGATLRGAGLSAVSGTESAKSIPFSFAIAGERHVTIAPAAGGGYPLQLGTVVLERIKPGQPALLEQPLQLVFSPDAAARGARVRADVALSSQNPAPLAAGSDVLLAAGSAQGATIELGPQTGRLMVRALVPASASEGTYRGNVVFFPQGAALQGNGLETAPQFAGAMLAPFVFTAEPEKRLVVKTEGWAADLGKMLPPPEGLRIEKKLRLAWSSSAARGGANARAVVRCAGPSEKTTGFASLKCGVQSGVEVRLTPQQEELTVALDVSAAMASGTYQAVIEILGDGCLVLCEAAPAGKPGPMPAMAVSFHIPRPGWIYVLGGLAVLALAGAWAYQASLPRFPPAARLTMEQGPGAPVSYYLRGRQGRFTRDLTVGGPGAAQVGIPGLTGRAFNLRIEGPARYAVTALSPLVMRLPDAGQEELAPSRTRTLENGAALKLGDIELVFNDRS